MAPPNIRASESDLERCRRDPSLADKIDRGLVVCLECGVMVARLVRSPNCHARRAHGLDRAQYLAKWPGAPLIGVGVEKADKQAHQDYIKNESNRVVINAARRANYAKKLDAAEASPESPEAAFINKERDRVAKINYENYWGAPTPEGVAELEAAAKVDPNGPAAKKLEGAAAFRESERQRKKARNPRSAQRARELMEERIAAAEANPDGPEAALLRAEREKKAKDQRELRRLAKVGKRFALHGTGGRPELAFEKTRDFEIGMMVENLIPRAAQALKAIEGLPSHAGRTLAALKAKLEPLNFTLNQIEKVLLFSKPTTLARYWVSDIAKTKDGRPMDYDSVARAHRNYLKYLRDRAA